VVVIGILNLGNLALARSRARLSEMGTRLAIGAGRFDVVRQLLVESCVIAVGGAAMGVAVGASLFALLRSRHVGIVALEMDVPVAALTLGLGVLAGVLVGVVSASPLFTMRLGTMLHDGARTKTQGRTLRATRRTLVVAQMACSFMLLLGSALLWVSLRNLLAVDLGFRTENVITGAVNLSGAKYAADSGAGAYVRESLMAIQQLPGVAAAGATTIVPMRGNYQTGIILAEGYEPQQGEPPVSGTRSYVTPGYFEAVGTPLVRGRFFDDREHEPDSRAIVIDDKLARRFWPDGDAVGRRMFRPANAGELSRADENRQWLTVIGVVGNARLTGPADDDRARGVSGTYYLPYAVSAPREVGLVVRTEREPAGIVAGLRSVLARVDPETPLFDVRTMSERTSLALISRTNAMHLAALFAAVAVFLSAVGLYGVLAYLVTQRTREIGIRLALGSTPGGIVQAVFREGLWMAIAGMALGVAGFMVLKRLVASQLYGVEPLDPWVVAPMMAALAAVAAIACIVPARRAAHVDVIRTLTAL
jgi:predicted permease